MAYYKYQKYDNPHDGVQEDINTKSDYNEARNQIFRLNNLWNDFNQHLRSGQLTKVKWDLECIWIELVADAKRVNIKKYFAEYSSANKKVSLSKSQYELFNALINKAIFLRIMQDEVGKGTKVRDDDDFDMD